MRLQHDDVGRVFATVTIRVRNYVELPHLPGPKSIAEDAPLADPTVVVCNGLRVFFGPLGGARFGTGGIGLLEGQP